MLARQAGAEIAMYKRYVDDTNIIIKGLPAGMRWVETERRLKQTHDTSDSDSMDTRTAREVRKMANTVAKSIQWEEAVPSRGENSPS